LQLFAKKTLLILLDNIFEAQLRFFCSAWLIMVAVRKCEALD